MEYAIFAGYLRNKLTKFSPRNWITQQLSALIATIVTWAFSLKQVQNAFVNCINCNTPIGQALNHQIESVVEPMVIEGIEDVRDDFVRSVDVNDVDGLDRAISDGVEEGLRDYVVRAHDVEDLDDAIDEVLSQNPELQEAWVENAAHALEAKQKSAEALERVKWMFELGVIQ